MHWHGVRLDNANDGTPDLTQPAVPPGGEFIYRLRFPDAGIYWYHPHVREDVQQELGLYGNMLVRPAGRLDFGPANREEVLMLDDLLLADDGLVPLGRRRADSRADGSVRQRAARERGAATTACGQTGRGRAVLPHQRRERAHVQPFVSRRADEGRRRATSGTYEREEWVESVVIAPAERYVVHVRFDRPGTVALVNRVRGLDHLYGRFFDETDTLGVVEVAAERGEPRSRRGSFATLRRRRRRSRASIERFRRLAPTRAGQDADPHARDARTCRSSPSSSCSSTRSTSRRSSGAGRCR